ncbi:hypothetical protein LDC_2023, partial [sediment metagenome]
ESLQLLIAEHPESAYIDDALFEMGKAIWSLKTKKSLRMLSSGSEQLSIKQLS